MKWPGLRSGVGGSVTYLTRPEEFDIVRPYFAAVLVLTNVVESKLIGLAYNVSRLSVRPWIGSPFLGDETEC